jgi:transcriptional regulator with XRE-family HTH domain
MPIPITGLRGRRKAAGIAARDLAAFLAVTAPVLYSWERGETLIPGSHLQALSRLFGVTVEQLRREDQATHAAFRKEAIARVTAVTAKAT